MEYIALFTVLQYNTIYCIVTLYQDTYCILIQANTQP